MRDICDKSCTPNLPQSPDIRQNSDGALSDFRISDQFLINENCPNFRTSHDINMKLGPETKMDKKNTETSKSLTMTSCPQIVTTLSIFQFIANL